MITRNYYKIVRVFPDPESYFYIKNESMSQENFTNNVWQIPELNNLEYSFDKVNWKNVNDLNYIPGDGYCYFRNISGTFGKEDKTIFFPYNNISIGGDVRTLFNYKDVESVTTIPEYGFSNLFSFQNSSKCIDISNLSFRGITEIGDYGLYQTFAWDYIGTKGVDLRDVTTLGNNALRQLYYDCSNLTEAYAPNVSTWDGYKTEQWLDGVASSGVIYKPTNLTIPTSSESGIPSGWTTQDYPTE